MKSSIRAALYAIALSLLVSFSLGLLAQPAHAFERKCTTSDLWRGPDKTKHAIAGAAIGAAVTAAAKDPLYGALAATGVALGKELIDRRYPNHTCSFQDFAVTAAAGWAGAYGTAWLIVPRRDGVQVAYVARF